MDVEGKVPGKRQDFVAAGTSESKIPVGTGLGMSCGISRDHKWMLQ